MKWTGLLFAEAGSFLGARSHCTAVPKWLGACHSWSMTLTAESGRNAGTSSRYDTKQLTMNWSDDSIPHNIPHPALAAQVRTRGNEHWAAYPQGRKPLFPPPRTDFSLRYTQ